LKWQARSNTSTWIEYQDTNRVQYELMRLLPGHSKMCASSATKTNPSTAGAGRMFHFVELLEGFPAAPS